MIPDDFLSEVKARVDLVAVIGEHVQLRKAGRSWKGLCPFHGEKSPSFHVTPDKGFFYCFGCHKKGDALAFLMEFSGLTFAEAVERLAAKAGLAVPKQEESPDARRRRSERQQMLDINRWATEFYEAQLQKSTGAHGRAYLESRGIGADVQSSFRIGLALREWSALWEYLGTKHADANSAIALGLIAPRPRHGGYYDKFRDRIMCPVLVPGGEIAGFSARLLTPTPDAPKYINSPESPVYKKGRLLFGLAQGREAIARKKRAILVEGNFDVISLHQAGLTETVAPLGTAFTPDHVETLRRMAEEVVLCYDGDRAGRAATRNALEQLVAADVPVRVVALPDGTDPDSLVQKEGAAGFSARIDRAVGGVEYYCMDAWGTARATAEGQSRALDDAAKLLVRIPNATKRDVLIARLADAMSVPSDLIRRAVARAAGGTRTEHRPPGGMSGARATASVPAVAPMGSTTQARSAPPTKPPAAEELELLSLLASDGELARSPEAEKAREFIRHPGLRQLAEALARGESILDHAATLPPGVGEQLIAGPRHPSGTAALMNQIAALEQRLASSVLHDLQRQLKVAQSTSDRETVRRLTLQIVDLRQNGPKPQ